MRNTSSLAGIRRVFWTTEEGTWKCAKVANLLSGMEDVAIHVTFADKRHARKIVVK
jgi:hypothetical protein